MFEDDVSFFEDSLDRFTHLFTALPSDWELILVRWLQHQCRCGIFRSACPLPPIGSTCLS